MAVSRRRPVETDRLRKIAEQFHLYGDLVEIVPYGRGHINDTYLMTINQAGRPVRYILQRLNTDVFRSPAAVMDNIARVTAHIARKLANEGCPDPSRRTLTMVPCRDGRRWLDDPDGAFRCYLFIEGARTFDQVETVQQAEAAARAVGRFQQQLVDFPLDQLVETIPNFHHTRRRFEAFRRAWAADPMGRAEQCRPEIEFALARESIVDVLLQGEASGELPRRVTHNDTKLNNVMLDDATGEGVCVIDLDTVMPGLVLYDFGDLCRTATRPTLEDEVQLERVQMRREMFEAIVRGYWSTAGTFLTRAEITWLAFSARLITFEIGLRFLTDYLEGDVYFKTHRPGHNLDRCRVQFRMVESFERNAAWMEDLVARTAATSPGDPS